MKWLTLTYCTQNSGSENFSAWYLFWMCIFSFTLLGRILKFDYVKSQEFTEDDRWAQENFKKFASVNKVGFIYINVISKTLLCSSYVRGGGYWQVVSRCWKQIFWSNVFRENLEKYQLTFGEHMQWIISTFSPGPIANFCKDFWVYQWNLMKRLLRT